MDRLTFDRWWEALPSGLKNPAVKAPCKRGWDAALLQSLSQEAVRDEALEEAASVDQREVELRGWREAIRVLKRDPNAAGEVERARCTLCSSEPSPGFYTGCMIQDGETKQTGWNCDGKGNLTRLPAPAAPDVESMVKRLRNCCTMIGYATSGAERTSHKRNADDAEAALLTRLGQGWIPVSERLPEDRENVLVLEYGLPVVKRLCIPDYLTPSRGITHWVPLPPLPGASDD